MRTKQNLITDYVALKNNSKGGIKRGFAFENLFNEMLELEGLNPSYSYKPSGEQIDGMFEYHSKFFHVECKWEAKPIPASSIYTLWGKIDGKLIGSLGVFVSMSDFSIDVPDTIQKGKNINILLFTKEDMDYCFSPANTFTKLLHIKMRYAALYGSVLYPISIHKQLLQQNKVK